MAGIRHDIISSVMVHSVLLAAALLIGGSSEIRKAGLLTVSLFDEKESSSGSKQTAAAGVKQYMQAIPAPKAALRAVTTSAAQPVISRQDPEPLAPVKVRSDTDRDSGPGVTGIGEQSNSSRAGEGNPSSDGSQTSRGGSEQTSTALASHAQKRQGADTGADISVKQRIRDALQANLVYPYIARKRRMEGTVLMEFRINGRGLPEAVRVVRGSSYAILDEAARETVMKTSPFPAGDNIVEVPIRFSLRGD